MPRTLTVARARVRDGSDAEYLAAIQALAALHEARGRHLWVFRRAGQPGAFLECRESRDAASRRAVVTPPDDERRLEARLRALAEYEDGSWDLWEEVRSTA